MKLRWIVVVVIVVSGVGIGVWNARAPQARVDVVTPRVETLRAYVEEQAVTELPHDVLISMPISGWLEPITLREGDEVTAGQIVARLETGDLEDRVEQAQQRIAVLETNIADTRDHRLEENMLVETRATVKAFDETVKAAEAKLKAAEALRDFALSEYKRVVGLGEESQAAPQEVRQTQTAWRTAEADLESDKLELAALRTLHAVSYIGPKFIEDYIDRKSFKLQSYEKQLEEAKASLAIEQRNLQRAEVASPADGVVLERHQTRRQYLAAGTPLLTIGRLDDLEVVAEILTNHAARLAPGDPVEVFGDAIAGGPIAGEVLRVYPAGFKKISSLGVEQQRVKVAVGLGERPERLGIAFRVYVRIFHDEAPNALTLPRTTLFRGDREGWQVLVVQNERIHVAAVEVGLMNEQRAQIVDGLAPEDRVVTRPSRDLVEGMHVATSE